MEGQNGRTKGNKKMECVLINVLVLQARLGKRAKSGFKNEAWEDVQSTLNCRFSRALTVAQVKNKMTVVSSSGSL
ncbi:hypothetical protein HOY80DRAFT_984162 [Tuber brumale]|nr:hypothetical protein HOY80DRAFT_984162 [Tuber brumale]